MKNFAVLYRCVHCAKSFEVVVRARYKSEGAADAKPQLHSCDDFRADSHRTQGIAHAFAIREVPGR